MAEYLLQSFTNFVGAENFTYYKLNTPGTIRLHLESLEGDADLYLSSETLNPDYDIYDVKSATCGEDIVEVGEDVERPVGVGVYGYPIAEKTKYHMAVIVITEDTKSSRGRGSQSGSHSASSQFNTKKDEEESIFSTILVGILKIILDILL